MIGKESETIEFKKTTAELKEAVIAIVAMLNKHGKGAVYFGVADDGKVIGQDIGRMTIKDVTQAVVDNIEPKIYPKVETREIAGKDCIIIEAQGINKPYYAYGRAYIRVGESNKVLSSHQTEAFVLSKKKPIWELEVSRKTIDDINEEVMKEFMRKAKTAKRINFDFVDVKTTLHKLHLLERENLLRAGEVMFCDDNPMEIQAAIFAGTDKLTFLDIKSFKGNLFSLRQQAEIYTSEHMKWRADLSESRRKEIPEIPVRAVSEAIGNSLCHRDFENPKGNEVAIFKDRIEIYNPGLFPQGIDPEDFFSGQEHSILRNPLIAETMYKSKDIERWGSGIKRIHDECAAAGIKVEFRRLKTGFVVIFYRPNWEEGEGLGKGGQKRWSENQSLFGEDAEKMRRRCGENAEKVFQAIRANGFIKTHEIAAQTQLAPRTVDNAILKLKKAGFIRRMGPDKGGYWEIV